MIIEKIKEARKKRNVEQKDLAVLVGLTQGTISNIERGRQNTGIQEIEAIFKALNYILVVVPKEDIPCQ